MGLENREYLRNEYGSSPGGFRWSSTSVIIKVILVTIAVFILQIVTTTEGKGSEVTRWLQLSPDNLFSGGQIWRLLTYAFCHNPRDLFHLAFNMISLYFIGDILLRIVGQREFLWFYCCSAIFAGMCAVLYYTIRQQPFNIVGASGAVCAAFGLVAFHFPRHPVMLMGLIRMEMRWMLVVFLLIPILFDSSKNGSIAHSAHFGGVLFAFLYFRSHMNISRWWDGFAGRMRAKRRNRGKLKIFAPPTTTESSLDTQMDAILEKISREGEASLTSRERNILIQASRQLRKSRDPE